MKFEVNDSEFLKILQQTKLIGPDASPISHRYKLALEYEFTAKTGIPINFEFKDAIIVRLDSEEIPESMSPSREPTIEVPTPETEYTMIATPSNPFEDKDWVDKAIAASEISPETLEKKPRRKKKSSNV